MQTVSITRRSDGKIRATDEEKRQLLDLLIQGHSMAEVARAHNLAIQTLVKWRRADAKRVGEFEKMPETKLSEPQSSREILLELKRLSDENQKLRKALGNVAYDRDILQEAYNIAVKKKWI